MKNKKISSNFIW